MGRLFDTQIALETALLWAVEFLLCFFAFYFLLHQGSGGSVGELAPTARHGGPASEAVLLALAVGLVSLAIGLHRPEICLRVRRLLLNTVVAALLAFPVVVLASVATGIDPSFVFGPDAFWPLKILLTSVLLLFLPRLGVRAILRLHLLSRNVLVVGPRAAARHTASLIALGRRGRFRLAGTVDESRLGGLSASWLRARRIRMVVVSHGAGLEAVRATLRPGRIAIESEARFCERYLQRLDIGHLPPDWLAAGGWTGGAAMALPRRIAEIAASLALLTFTLPLLLIVALLIKLDSPGPVLYRQERVGLGGRRFTLYKLRSMRADAEAAGPVWAAPRDGRVTGIGALIRLVRIDELPQLINVLRGEMSLVGPRPERPPFVARLADAIPHYAERARVKPGITGWAQVNCAYGASIEDARQKLAYDLYYVKHRSLVFDAMIVLATIRVILFQEGAR